MHRRSFIKYSTSQLILFQNKLNSSVRSLLKRSIPSTGEQLPVLGLGTWRVFDIGNDQRENMLRSQVLTNLNKIGGKLIDTSPMYGRSQAVLGDLCNALNIRSQFFYANKVWISGESEGIAQMNESFTKMKTNTIDLMQVHNLIDVKTHLKTLRGMKEAGKIRYIGITHYLPSAYPELIRWINSEKLDFVQFNYNIADREAENKLLPLALDKGLAVITNRPFREGQLFNQVLNKKLPSWAHELEIKSWAQFFLKFILSHRAVCFTIPATSDPAHMIENLQAGIHPLPDITSRPKMVAYFESL